MAKKRPTRKKTAPKRTARRKSPAKNKSAPVAATIGGHPLRRRPIAELYEDPQNARRHGEKNLDAIEASVNAHGQVLPLVTMPDGKVVGGNGTLSVFRDRLGWNECDCVEYQGTEEQARALAIALNRTAELAEWDDEALKATLDSLADSDFDLESIGFAESDLDELLARVDASLAGESNDDQATSPNGGDDSTGNASASTSSQPTEKWQVLVECNDEAHQRELLERFEADGLQCRPLIV